MSDQDKISLYQINTISKRQVMRINNVIELSGVIWAKIIGVISKSNKRAARVRFEITSMISDQN